MAMLVLKSCRAGEPPAAATQPCVLTLRGLLPEYAKAKGIKASSLKRYQSLVNTHFQEWAEQPIVNFRSPAFAEHCHSFAQSKGAALVETGRGLIGALIKYVNAVHRIDVPNPFERLASAGLMPERAQPRARKLQMNDLAKWHQAVNKLPELQRDYLILLALTGLRRNEGANIKVDHVDFERERLTIPETKNGKAHTLPITPYMKEILVRRCQVTDGNSVIFNGLSADHVAKMAMRLGAPAFMLHDLRKLFATTGAKLKVGDAALRRILNHTAKRSDVLHRNYVSLSLEDVRGPLLVIQTELMMQNPPSNA
jgi:integrase